VLWDHFALLSVRRLWCRLPLVGAGQVQTDHVSNHSLKGKPKTLKWEAVVPPPVGRPRPGADRSRFKPFLERKTKDAEVGGCGAASRWSAPAGCGTIDSAQDRPAAPAPENSRSPAGWINLLLTSRDSSTGEISYSTTG